MVICKARSHSRPIGAVNSRTAPAGAVPASMIPSAEPRSNPPRVQATGTRTSGMTKETVPFSLINDLPS
jgi:hypothetical protein